MNRLSFVYAENPQSDAPGADASGPEARSPGLNRRDFFKVGAAAGGGLLLSLYLPPRLRAEGVREAPRADGVLEANAFVRIDPDGTVTFTSPKSEMGQGIRTALAMIVAEELDADWDHVRVEQASLDEKYGGQGTGGSSSIRTRWIPLRTAAAATRAMLVTAAAQTWGVDPAACSTEQSAVLDPAGGRRLSYGELAARAAALPVPQEVALKDPKDFRLIGSRKVGVDVQDIVQGKAVYGMDLRVPGMLYAVIERCPVFGGRVASFDAAAARAVPGVRAVVEIPATGRPIHVASGVAVVAETTWAAMKGREALEIAWAEGPNANDSSEGLLAAMRRATEGPAGEVFNEGDADAVLADAGSGVGAVYELPFLSHSPMEPMNCTAHVQGDRVEVWAPTQNPGANARDIAEVLGIPEANVRVHLTLMGGGFGRRLESDFAVEAAVISRLAGAPVKVVWTREDDTRHCFYRPLTLHRVDAALGPDGLPTALRHRIASTSLRESDAGPDAENLHAGDVSGAVDMPYRIPNRRLEFANVSAAIPRGPWRSVAHTHTAFAVESFIDEMAAAAGRDPVEYRLALLEGGDAPDPDDPYAFDPARLRAVIRLVAEKAGWGRSLPEGRGLGIASHYSFRAYAAQVAEVSLDDDGVLHLHRVVSAIDCGQVINPDSATNQVQGAVIDALSVTLRAEITMRAGRVEQGNFHDYQLLRMNEAPGSIDVHFVESNAAPSGLGEPALPPLAPALANAIFAATGRRMRTLPLRLPAVRG